MNLIQRVRRGGAVAAVLAAVAMAAGAVGADAHEGVIDEPVATEVPAETGGGEEAPPGPTETTEAPVTTEQTDPPSETAPTTTVAPPPSSTTPPPPPPVKGGPPTPADAIATTTTVPAAVEPPVAVVAKPSAPTSPVATPSNGSVKLTWKAPTNNGGAAIQKYAVQRYTAQGWTSIAYPTALSYTNTGLTNGTKYSFRILAYNAAGWSAPSTTVVAVPRTVPSAPLSPVATPSNGSVKLTWKAPTSNGGAAIQKYAVQRYNTVSKKWENVAFPTTSPFANTSLANGTKYSYRVLAQNAAGWGTPSSVVAATPNGPSAPLSPVATPGNSKVTLTWNAPATAGAAVIDKYAVQRMIPGVSGWENIAFPTTRSYTAFGLNGTKYSFRILAHTAIGYGPASTVVSAVPRTVPGAPFAVQATPTDAYVGLTWSAPPTGGAAIDKYRVRMATSLNGPWETFESVNPVSVTEGGFGSLHNGTTYYFQVAARNAAGWGQYSWAVKAVPRTVPAAPGLSATPVNPTNVKLNWTRPAQNGGAPIELYRFEQAPDPGGPWTLIATTQAADMASGSEYVDGLEPGTTYYFRAAAVNAAGQGPYTAAITATTPATLPGAPTACSAFESSYHMAYLDWHAPATDGGSPIVNYNILIQKGEYKYQWVGNWGYWYWDPEANVVNYDTVGPFTDHTELLPSGDYHIAIRARNSVGQGPACAAEVHIT
jgi:hypothetical protein